LVEKSGAPGENDQPVTSHRQTLTHKCCTPRPDRDWNSHQW
jgi:hypothetical protein